MAELPAVLPLSGVPRHYAWGSVDAVARLLGDEPDGRPIAELWFGSHEDDPSPAGEHGALDALIAANPTQMLGADVAARYDGRLPFLVKVLAAASPLSIQVHPDRAQARAGYDAEDARGIARDAPERNYRDRNHKPELLCALTPFEALCGFRPVDASRALLESLAVGQLNEVAALLAGPDGLRAAFVHLLSVPEPADLVDAVVGRCAQFGPADAAAGPAGVVLRTAAAFPGDIGAVLSLLLNHVRLEPGEAIFLGAGNVHCYLSGLGVEVMANSDNVLRCGLTAKHVDVAEVLAVTDFSPLPQPRLPAAADAFGTVFDVPAPDFAVSTLDLDAYKGSCAVGGHGPYLVLCTSGSVRVRARTADAPEAFVDLRPGRAAYVRPRQAAFRLDGTGRVFLATVGGAPHDEV